MTFPFNLGFTAINTLKAVKSDALAANSQVGETRDMIEQLVRDTWANMNTSKITYKFMANQAVISAEFLELARKERKAGNKTLLDVLTGETGLINAQADATSAETDVLISTFTLLNAMGRLTLNVIP
jgi:adhesin transport system outer membrane protein